MYSEFHVDLDPMRELGIFFAYTGLPRLLADAIGTFDGQRLAMAIENEWQEFLRANGKVIWRREGEKWKQCAPRYGRINDLLRHQMPFGVLLPIIAEQPSSTTEPFLFLEFSRSQKREGLPYICHFSVRDKNAGPIPPKAITNERQFVKCISRIAFPDGTPLADNPGIVWRALAHIARNPKDPAFIEHISDRLLAGASTCIGDEFSIKTELVLKTDLSDVGVRKYSPISLTFSKDYEPCFSFGDNGEHRLSCSECLPLLEQYAYIPPLVLSELASIVEEEDWTFVKEDGGRIPFGRLRFYLNATFEKISQDHKSELDKIASEIVVTPDGDAEVFCTGLRHRTSGLYVYAHCSNLNHESGTFERVDWVYQKQDEKGNFVAHPLLEGLDRPSGKKNHGLPYPADWTRNPKELILPYRDLSLKNIRIDYRHIFIDNHDRLDKIGIFGDKGDSRLKPLVSSENLDLLERRVQNAWPRTRKLLASNYKVAVPVWHNHKISILLPLFLDETNPKVPTIALVIAKNEKKKEPSEPDYVAPTCLTLEMARSNARVIARVDDTWLTPISMKALPRQLEELLNGERDEKRKALLSDILEKVNDLNSFDEIKALQTYSKDQGENRSTSTTALGSLESLLPELDSIG